MAATKSSKKSATDDNSVENELATDTTNEVLKVTQEETSKHTTAKATTTTNVEAEVPAGKILMGELDDDGKDTGNEFLVSKSTYEKYYADNEKFIIKKKHNKWQI